MTSSAERSRLCPLATGMARSLLPRFVAAAIGSSRSTRRSLLQWPHGIREQMKTIAGCRVANWTDTVDHNGLQEWTAVKMHLELDSWLDACIQEPAGRLLRCYLGRRGRRSLELRRPSGAHGYTCTSAGRSCCAPRAVDHNDRSTNRTHMFHIGFLRWCLCAGYSMAWEKGRTCVASLADPEWQPCGRYWPHLALE